MADNNNDDDMAQSHEPGRRAVDAPVREAAQAKHRIGPAPLSLIDCTTGRVIVERRQPANRRERSWVAFLYGNFRPRRREGRRESDDHLFLFDWYEPRVLYVTLGVLLLSCIDALFTLNLLHLGAAEANFVMASALEHSVEWFLACKISLTAVSLVFLTALVRRKFFRNYSVEHLLQLFFSAYILVICYEIYLFEFVFNFQLFPAR